MNRRLDVEKSWMLENRIAESVERFRQNAERAAKLKREIVRLRRERRQPLPYPQEVIDWYAETEDEDDAE